MVLPIPFSILRHTLAQAITASRTSHNYTELILWVISQHAALPRLSLSLRSSPSLMVKPLLSMSRYD
jgi:hypothetical protein